MTAAAERSAERMGRRAGETFRQLGIPSRCPLRPRRLAAAWRRGYFAELGRAAYPPDRPAGSTQRKP